MAIYLNPKERLNSGKEEVQKEKVVVAETNQGVSLDELKAMAKEQGIKNYWNMKEDKLRELLGL